MSEKPQRESDVSEENVSHETPRGELRSDSEHPDGHSPSRSAAPPSPTEPEDGVEETPEVRMLREIMDRALEPAKPRAPEEEPVDVSCETSDEEKPAPSPAEDKRNKRSSVYVYLAILFGAAFLMLLLAYFVQQRNNAAVQDDLRTATASRQELLDSIKALEEEKAQLQAELDSQREQAEQTEEDLRVFLEASSNLEQQFIAASFQKQQLSYLWFLERFMEAKDYPMASAVMMYARELDPDLRIVTAGGTDFHSRMNPAQEEQYYKYRQELIDRGYLTEVPDFSQIPLDSQLSTKPAFTEKWDPTANEDAAALAILWCALEQYYVYGNDEAAAFYLSYYLSGGYGPEYLPLLEDAASPFTLRQFQLMKDALIEAGALQETPEGGLEYADGFGHTDVIYGLPFDRWAYAD